MTKTIPKILIFEGLDRSGKTSLRKALLKHIPDQMTIDRLFASQLVYDTFYNRHENDSFLDEMIELFKQHCVIVYVKCSYREYVKRCSNTKHEILTKNDFEYQSDLFNKILDKIEYNIVVIDTTIDNTELACSKLLNELDILDIYK